MNEKRELLLFLALKNGGTISVNRANKIYSGNNGKDALVSLAYLGYFEMPPDYGVFKINEDQLDELPEGVVERYRNYKGSKDNNSGKDKEAEYEKVFV